MLPEHDRIEWQDVARRLCPKWTDADFDREWTALQAAKAKRKAH